MYSLKIINGLVPNYETNEFVQKDILIEDGKIVKIGDVFENAEQVIDASGKIVSPGFVDIHAHEEKVRLEKYRFFAAERALSMGVTTMICGNCGINEQDMDVYYNYVSNNGCPSNQMMFLGHNYLREKVGIDNVYRAATKEEINKMKELVRKNSEYDFLGLSYGIEYSPGSTIDEMVEVAKAFEGGNNLLSAHYRYDGEQSSDAINELITISKETKMPMQISHIGSCSALGYMEESLKLIENARKNNIDITSDCYPYEAFCTEIGTAVFDDGCFERWGKDYSDILLTEKPYQGVRCDKELFEKVRKEHPRMLVVAFAMNEKEIEMAYKSPFVFVSSDGGYNEGMGHPRGAGTFARVLGRFVREKNTISLIDALKKMTVLPAKRVNLTSKGEIKVGYDADIVIFDEKTIIDKADYDNPTLPPVGIDKVIISGKVAVDNNIVLNNSLGRYVKFK